MKKEEVKDNIEETKKKSYKKYWITLLIAAIIVCLVSVGVIVLLSRLQTNVGNMTVDKPVIYLYPEATKELTVILGNPEKLTCTYPEYNKGWNVIASTDGTLIDTKTSRELYCLYWEGKGQPKADMTEGFVVSGKDTVKFLEEKLEVLGLTNKEAEEFIIYWLPKLQNNKYNYIRFATVEEINEYMPLELSITPDSVIRILMQYKALDEKIDVIEQKLATPVREGFAVVEWGGTEIK